MEDKLTEQALKRNEWLSEEMKVKKLRIPYQGQARVTIIALTILFLIGYIATAGSYYYKLNI